MDKLLNALFLGKVLNKMSEKAKSKGNMMLLLQEVKGEKKNFGASGKAYVENVDIKADLVGKRNLQFYKTCCILDCYELEEILLRALYFYHPIAFYVLAF